MTAQLELGRSTGAVFSEDRVYRYALWRTWDRPLGVVNFVMLNPSTADEHANDPTVERCERFARRWGYGGLTVTNLYALRSTDPGALRDHPDPVGPGNDRAIRRCASVFEATVVVVAWGNHGSDRAHEVLALLGEIRPASLPVVCLGVNRTGQPVHPLYQRSDTPLHVYAEARDETEVWS